MIFLPWSFDKAGWSPTQSVQSFPFWNFIIFLQIDCRKQIGSVSWSNNPTRIFPLFLLFLCSLACIPFFLLFDSLFQLLRTNSLYSILSPSWLCAHLFEKCGTNVPLKSDVNNIMFLDYIRLWCEIQRTLYELSIKIYKWNNSPYQKKKTPEASSSY